MAYIVLQTHSSIYVGQHVLLGYCFKFRSGDCGHKENSLGGTGGLMVKTPASRPIFASSSPTSVKAFFLIQTFVLPHCPGVHSALSQIMRRWTTASFWGIDEKPSVPGDLARLASAWLFQALISHFNCGNYTSLDLLSTSTLVTTLINVMHITWEYKITMEEGSTEGTFSRCSLVLRQSTAHFIHRFCDLKVKCCPEVGNSKRGLS